MRNRFGPYLELLRGNPAFTRLFVAQLISFAGDWFATVALLGLALELSGSPTIASLVLVLQSGGFAIASPLTGILADRFDRRVLLVAADLLRVPIALAFILARTPDTLWIALLAVLLLEICSAVFEPASSAALPNLVDEDELAEANVLLGSAWGVMLAVGAAVGGVVAATLGRDAAFVINALTFLVSAALILGIRRPFQLPREARTTAQGAPLRRRLSAPLDSLRPVIAFARHSRIVSALLLSKTMFGVGTGVVLLLAVFGQEVFRAGDVGIGVLFAARGLGALFGPFVARALVGIEYRGLIIGITGSLVTVVIAYAVFPLVGSIWLAAAVVLLAHLGSGAQWTLSTIGLQRATPDAIRGRVFSFDFGLVTLVIAVSNILAGAIAEGASPQIAVWVMVALIAVAGSLWTWFSSPIWRNGQLEADHRAGTAR